MTKQIKFQKYYVTNGEKKARVHYSFGALCDGSNVVTLYAKDYTNDFADIFAGQGYENNTDIQTDYFEKGLVRIRPESPLFEAALARC